MAYFRGQDGYLSLGGQLQGSAFVNGSFLATQSSINVDGNGGTLLGTVAVGDKFTIAGETGSPVHTVTGGPFFVAAGNAIGGLTFTPGLATGGVADNAAITFTSNAVAQITAWSMTVTLDELDTTCMGDAWKSVVGGQPQWTGQATARIDLADPRQAALVAEIVAGTPDGTIAALTLGMVRGTGAIKQFYGGCVLKNIQVQQQLGQIVPITFDFTGSGSVLSQWV